jgi:hypothetical protein
MPLKRKIWLSVGPWLMAWILRIWFGTLRVEVRNQEVYRDYFLNNRDKKVVAGCWHRNAIFFIYFFRTLPQNRILMVSRSRDGEFTARLGRYLGYNAVRGSAASGREARGGVSALKALIGHLNETPGACFAGTAVDGPQGPPRKLKKGLLLAAKQTNAFFIPMACSGTALITFTKAWDKTIIPLPFSKVVVTFHAPFPLKRDDAPEEVNRLQREAEQALNHLTDEVDSVCGYEGVGGLKG